MEKHKNSVRETFKHTVCVVFPLDEVTITSSDTRTARKIIYTVCWALGEAQEQDEGNITCGGEPKEAEVHALRQDRQSVTFRLPGIEIL